MIFYVDNAAMDAVFSGASCYRRMVYCASASIFSGVVEDQQNGALGKKLRVTERYFSIKAPEQLCTENSPVEQSIAGAQGLCCGSIWVEKTFEDPCQASLFRQAHANSRAIQDQILQVDKTAGYRLLRISISDEQPTSIGYLLNDHDQFCDSKF